MSQLPQCSTWTRHTDKRSGPGRFGRRPVRDPVYPPDLAAAARTLRARGVSGTRIAQFFVVSRFTVYGWLRDEGDE